MGTIDEVTANLATQLLGGVAEQCSPLRLRTTETTISYQSGRRSVQTSEIVHDAAMVAGRIDPAGRKLAAVGDAKNLNGDGVFEIGSIGKVFTSLLMAEMAERGEVAIDEPIKAFLPAEVRTPQRNGREITLVDLATHTSGLPRMPGNAKPKNVGHPFAHYGANQLYEFLSSVELHHDIGDRFEYSNIGVALLGHCLSMRTGIDYLDMVRNRITLPLGMHHTACVLTPSMRDRQVLGHDERGAPLPESELPMLAGAGGIRSTANDMLTFLEACLGIHQTPLAPAMARMLTVRRPTGQANVDLALAWFIVESKNGTIVQHGGAINGHRAFIGFNPQLHRAVVVLADAIAAAADAVGMQLLMK